MFKTKSKSKLISVFVALVMVLQMLPWTAMPVEAAGETASVSSFAELKAAMENPDITDVYLGAVINEEIDTDVDNSAAIQVAGRKNLYLTVDINITQLNTSKYASLFALDIGDELHIIGTAKINFSPVLSGGVNSVVYLIGTGEVTIAGGATLESRSTATNAYGNAIWAGVNSKVTIGAFSTLIGTRGKDNTNNPVNGYALIVDDTANVDIQGAANGDLADAPEFIVNNLEGVTGTNPSVKIEETAGGTISGGIFNGIEITNASSLSITQEIEDYVAVGSTLANYSTKVPVSLITNQITEKVGFAYEITFDANSGTFGSDTTVTQYTVDSKIGAFPASEPTRSGYDFEGYNTHSISSEGININTNRFVSADTIYYAVWSNTADTYSVSANPTSVALGTIKEGEALPEAETVTITNDGASELTNLRVNSTDYTVTFTSTTLAKNANTIMTITPNVTVKGNHDTSLLIFADGASSSIGNVPVTFEITEGTYSVSANPTSVALGTIKEGETLPSIDVTITNIGTATLDNLRVNAANYTVTFDDTSIANGESATMTVTPKNTLTAVANYDTTLSIFADGASSSVGSVPVIFSITNATYNLTVVNGTGSGSFVSGHGATITADTPETGKFFDKWTVTSGSATINNANSATTTVVIGSVDATVTASYKDTPQRQFSPELDEVAFADLVTGYYSAENIRFGVQNTGSENILTGDASATLTGKNSTSFTLDENGIGSGIAANEWKYITITPKPSLVSGTYEANIQITGTGVETVNIPVSLEVVEAPTYKLQITPNPHTFANATVGYSPITAETFTIRSIGSGAVWNLKVELSDESKFILDDSSTWGGLSISGTSTTFTLAPKDNLGVGTHTVNILINAREQTQHTGTSMTQISIPVSFTVLPGISTGVNVTGQVTSYNPKLETNIILTDTTDDTVKFTTKIEALATGSGQQTQNFTIPNVPAGTYNLLVEKGGHLDYTINGVVVGSSDLDLTENGNAYISNMSMIAGDVTGNGSVNVDDVNAVKSNSNYNMASNIAANALADTTGNGSINIDDVSLIKSSVNFNKQVLHTTFTYTS